jgi:hypothetical protein
MHITDTWREVGGLNTSGFLKFKYKEKAILIHRVIYKKKYGKLDPDLNVTHIDGDKLNNKGNNLEQCTQQESQCHRFDEERYNNEAVVPQYREPHRLRAIELRKKGLSYKQIQKELNASGEVNVSKGSLSKWLKDVKLTKKQKEELHNRMVTENNNWRVGTDRKEG